MSSSNSLSSKDKSKYTGSDDGEFVWVRIGKTDHAAFVVQCDPERQGQTLVRWSSTRKKEWVDNERISKELPSRRKRLSSNYTTSHKAEGLENHSPLLATKTTKATNLGTCISVPPSAKNVKPSC